MTLIGSLAVNIVARTDGLRKGLKRTNRDVDRFGNRVERNIGVLKRWHSAIAGVAGISGLGFLIQRQLQEIDALGKVADRLGIATEALTGLHHAAELSGVSTQTLEMGLQRMIRRVSEAAAGTGEAKDAIRELGLDAVALASLAPEDQFGAIADALNRVNRQTERVRLAFKLFDSEGVRLVQLTESGSQGLAAMADEADRLGKSLSRLEVKQVENLNDSITRLKASFSGLGREATTNLASPLAALADSGRDMLENIRLLGRATGRGLQAGKSATGGMNAISRQFGFVPQAFMREFLGTLREPAAARAQANIARFTAEREQRRAAQERPAQLFLENTRQLGDRIQKLTGSTTNLVRQFTMFPSRVRTDSLIQQLQSFGRFFAGFERTQIQGRDPIGDIKKQFGAFGRFFGGLAFRPEQSFRTGTNAAIEAGTREAYIANQSGKRRQHLARIAEQQKKEINLAEAANNLLQSIRDKLKDTAQTVGIP